MSARILEIAGSSLIEECRKKYCDGIGECLVAVTDSHGLKQVKQLFHIVLPQKGEWTKGMVGFLFVCLFQM